MILSNGVQPPCRNTPRSVFPIPNWINLGNSIPFSLISCTGCNRLMGPGEENQKDLSGGKHFFISMPAASQRTPMRTEDHAANCCWCSIAHFELVKTRLYFQGWLH